MAHDDKDKETYELTDDNLKEEPAKMGSFFDDNSEEDREAKAELRQTQSLQLEQSEEHSSNLFAAAQEPSCPIIQTQLEASELDSEPKRSIL